MKAPPRPGFLLVAAREWRWMRRDRLALFLAIGVPVFAFAVLALIFSNAVIRNLKVTVVDADRSPTSLTYVQATASAPGISVAERSGDMSSAMHAIRSGDAIAAIYIPENFERDLVAQQRPKIVALYNRQYFTPGNSASAAISNAVAAATATLPRATGDRRAVRAGIARCRAICAHQPGAELRPVPAPRHSCRPFCTSSSRSPLAMRSGQNFRGAACAHGSRPPAAARSPRFSASSRRCLRFSF